MQRRLLLLHPERLFIVVGAIFAIATVAEAVVPPVTVQLAPGATLHVECAGSALNVQPSAGAVLDLNCVPWPTATVTEGPRRTVKGFVGQGGAG